MEKVKYMETRTTGSLILTCCLLLLSVTVFSCNSGYTSWEKDKPVNGIEFEKIRYAIKDNDTTAVIGYLKVNTVIEQYPCAADWVHFTKDWKLKLFRLSAKTPINNYSYDENTWVRFADDSSLMCVFPQNTPVQGYLCRGGGGVKGISTSFYKSGKLHYFFSEGDVKVGDVLCKSDAFNNIGLYEDGSLQEATLAQETKIKNISYGKNTRLLFDQAGNVKAQL